MITSSTVAFICSASMRVGRVGGRWWTVFPVRFYCAVPKRCRCVDERPICLLLCQESLAGARTSHLVLFPPLVETGKAFGGEW